MHGRSTYDLLFALAAGDDPGWTGEQPEGVGISYVMRVFDQLIFNVDRNLTNLLIRKNWDIEMIDHSRSFRLSHNLENPKNLAKCERTLLANLRALDKDTVMKQLMPYCTKSEVEAVMARRDVIVKFFDDQVKQKGESAVLYDLQKIKAKTASGK